MGKYKAQLQPDYVTGANHKIVVSSNKEYVPVDIIIAEFETCGLMRLFEVDESDEFKFDVGAEFPDDFLLVTYEEDWEINIRPVNNDAILYRLMSSLKNSSNFYLAENLKHPVFAKPSFIFYMFLSLAAICIIRIGFINESPGDPSIGGWSLALFALLISAVGAGFHAAIGQVGASIGTKFPKPMNLNFIAGEFAALSLLFLFVFSN